MRRHSKSVIGAVIVIIFISFVGINLTNDKIITERAPAAAKNNVQTQTEFDHTILSVEPTEFQNSKPALGRSYFDQIFSTKDKYQIPYPFNQFLAKLADYSGQKMFNSDSSGLKMIIFPMGRSLQRNAAVEGLKQEFSFEPFFRYPRVVVGVDEEPSYENSIVLNLKNKFYVGFNERAQILEVISYNDDEGRYEYQVVRDYNAAQKPRVIYANRGLCLSCHQNQTPIFSRGPWSESNANPVVADKLKATLDQSFGTQTCLDGENQTYCLKNNNSYYYGVPLKIEATISSRFDTSTDQANLIHAYQKMWKELCVTTECKISMLKSILAYRLSGNSNVILSTESVTEMASLEIRFKAKYPAGLAIPSPNIPDRDPLKYFSLNTTSVQELLSHSKNPTEFEPLLPRQPIDIWKNSGIDASGTNLLVRGLAQEFTNSDVKLIDQWLKKNNSEKNLITELEANCKIEKQVNNLAITCFRSGIESFELSAYLQRDVGASVGAGLISDFNYQSKVMNCQEECPTTSELTGEYRKIHENLAVLQIHKNDGLSLRSQQGYHIAEITFNLTTQKAKLKIFDQKLAMNQIIRSQLQLFSKISPFNRFQIMKNMVEVAKIKVNRIQPAIHKDLDFEVEGELTENKISQKMDGFSMMKNVCIRCHQNNEAVPPNFMGSIGNTLNDEQLCRRIEQCAPRMLYRLKMRNCPAEALQRKKNPMPPASHFKNNPQQIETWMNQHNPQVLSYISTLVNADEMAQDFSARGLAMNEASQAAHDIIESECPNSNSVIYDLLPKCEFNQLKTKTRCR